MFDAANWSGYDATTASVTPHVDPEEAPNYAQTPGPAGVVADANRRVLPGRIASVVPADGQHLALWGIVVTACLGLLLIGHGLNGVKA